MQKDAWLLWGTFGDAAIAHREEALRVSFIINKNVTTLPA